MKFRQLGRTGVQISAIAFGAGPISSLMVGDDAQRQIAVVEHALERGINWFDTAATYGAGNSETSLGRALEQLAAAARVHVATKVRLVGDDLRQIGDAVRRSCEQSLARLRLSKVTLLQLHNSITRDRNDEPTSITESPIWLNRRLQALAGVIRPEAQSVFRPPILKFTLIGIALGTVPQMGSWGSSNWLVPWANQVQEEIGNRELSAWTQWTKSSGAAIGSLLGGWFASQCGRRTAYFLISVFALGSSAYIFNFLTPLDDSFLTWVFVQGFVGTVYFGWLPLYLPELFPTDLRATGTGVSFNWGRVSTAAGVLAGGHLIRTFGGDYARVGQVTCLVYAVGAVIIGFAPDTTERRLEE